VRINSEEEVLRLLEGDDDADDITEFFPDLRQD
jgi:hypothetical protein